MGATANNRSQRDTADMFLIKSALHGDTTGVMSSVSAGASLFNAALAAVNYEIAEQKQNSLKYTSMADTSDRNCVAYLHFANASERAATRMCEMRDLLEETRQHIDPGFRRDSRARQDRGGGV